MFDIVQKYRDKEFVLAINFLLLNNKKLFSPT